MSCGCNKVTGNWSRGYEFQSLLEMRCLSSCWAFVFYILVRPLSYLFFLTHCELAVISAGQSVYFWAYFYCCSHCKKIPTFCRHKVRCTPAHLIIEIWVALFSINVGSQWCDNWFFWYLVTGIWNGGLMTKDVWQMRLRQNKLWWTELGLDLDLGK